MKPKSKSDPYKSTRFKICRKYPEFGIVAVDIHTANLLRLQVLAKKHEMPIDHLLSCALGFIAFHGDEVLKDVFAGAERGRRLAAIRDARR